MDDMANQQMFIVEREDKPGVAIVLCVQDFTYVSDILRFARIKFNFESDVVLSVHEVGSKKRITESSPVRDIASLRTVLLRHTSKNSPRTDMVKNQKRSVHENRTITRKGKNLLTGQHANYKSVRSNTKTRNFDTDSTQHTKPMSGRPETSSKNRTKNHNREEKDEEIRILNRQLKYTAPMGFTCEIVPEEYKSCTNSSTVFFTSDEERKATQSRTNNLSSWRPGNRSLCLQGDKNLIQKTGKSRSAIVTKTRFHEIRNFSVQIKLDDRAMKHAKTVLKSAGQDKKEAIEKFCETYGSKLYTGRFSAGGWFSVSGEVTSRDAVNHTSLIERAKREIETHWHTKGRSRFLTDYPVFVTLRTDSYPFHISSERDLENNIKNVDDCTVFPTNGKDESQFIPIYEIMQNQADEIGDKELRIVSELLKIRTEGEPALDTTGCDPDYVVFLGDVGTGKSTIVEKLTGEENRSSNASESATRSFRPFYVPENSLIVSDTPGSNPRKDKLKHNIGIAAALNYKPVSRIFIVVKAEPRIDSVIDNVLKYADNFVVLPFDVVGVLVSHMDTVEWREEEFIEAVNDELGIESVVFSEVSTKGETLLTSILKTCKEKHNLTIDDEHFSKLFNIQYSDRKVLQFTSDEVKKFSAKKKEFDKERKQFSGSENVDLVFEFQAYMTDEILDAEKRMSKQNNFTFKGKEAALEAGHVLNMVNQLNVILRDIRAECTKLHCEYNASECRKCPYCGFVKTLKGEASSGNETCGGQRLNRIGTRHSSFAKFGTFTFEWSSGKLKISKNEDNKSRSSATTGCGQTISWEEMAPVGGLDVAQSSVSEMSQDDRPSSGRVRKLINRFEALATNFFQLSY